MLITYTVFPSETMGHYNVELSLSEDYDGAGAFQLIVSVDGNNAYMDGVGFLQILNGPSQNYNWWSTIVDEHPRSTLRDIYSADLKVKSTLGGDTWHRITLPPIVTSDRPLHWTQLNIRHRWEVRGLLLDHAFFGIYKDLAQLLGAWDSNGNHTYLGLLDNLEAEVKSDRDGAFSESGTVTTLWEDLEEVSGNPIFARYS